MSYLDFMQIFRTPNCTSLQIECTKLRRKPLHGYAIITVSEVIFCILNTAVKKLNS